MIDDGTGVFDLPRAYASRYGVPIIYRVDLTVFEKQYFTNCLSCTFCGDLCCSFGVDVDLHHREAIEEKADAIEAYTGIDRERWFVDEVIEDAELPGGGSVRTRVVDGACVFLNRQERGCLLHSYCTDMGIDYHDLKSVVDCLFPLVVADQTLSPADEVDDRTLVCVGHGQTLYRGLRDELRYYFGDGLIEMLDGLEESHAPRSSTKSMSR